MSVSPQTSGGGMEVPGEENEFNSESYLLGFIIANIVGIQHYTGTISKREMVGLVREPLNPFDPNAIKVVNIRSIQVGHIERSVAAVIAPLIDSRVAIVEGVVPKPQRNSNGFRIPCQLHIFANPNAAYVVISKIRDSGLQLLGESDAAFGFSEAAFVLEKKLGKIDGDSILDKIFALVCKDVGRKYEALEPSKEVILSELFPHQKEGLGWMIYRENSVDLPPFWEEKNGSYLNILSRHETSERPDSLRGGIFADDMGLGKTLTLLSLISLDKMNFLSLEEINDSLAASSSSKGKVSRKYKKRRIDSGKSLIKNTLVVCPPSVLTSWITQLEEHTKPGSLKVYLYQGERTRDMKELMKYDIVLTTYSTLSMEFESSESPIKGMEWFRVILDEAHLIKNYAARQTKAVIALKAERRWAVTGTPIQNNSFDLFSLMAFLRFQPFSVKTYWQRLVQRPLDQGSKSGLSRLQVLMGAISLRRMKDLVGLPPKTVMTCYVDFSSEERERYDLLENEARSTVRSLVEEDNLMINYSTVLHILLRLRQICNDASLCPPNIASLFSSNALQDVSNNPDLFQKLVNFVQDGDDFECPICLSPPKKTIITSCAHIFCDQCISRVTKQVNARCPICRHPLSRSDIFLAPAPSSEENLQVGYTSSSSKIQALIKMLEMDKIHHPSSKSVIFSQFRKFLVLLEEPLKASGFRVLRLDGSMSLKKRAQVIDELSYDGGGNSGDSVGPTVLLASLKASGIGVNLTAASRVYLIEPWWNPAVEEQAMDRVHRIGQREEVRVVRFVVRETIEERILELQEKKRRLAQGAFKKKDQEEQRRMMEEDVRMMMRL